MTPPIVLSDVQESRLITHDLSHNIHLTVTEVTTYRYPTTSTIPTATTTTSASATSNTMSVKPDPENLVHFDILSDAYADLLSAPKEPNVEQPLDLKPEVQPPLQISDVRTIGTGIKIKTDASPSTIITKDPNCYTW